MQYRKKLEPSNFEKTSFTVLKKKMKITILTCDEQIITLNVDHDGTVEDLKALMEVETRVPVQQQQMLFNGKEMIMNSERLRTYGVMDGDLLEMKPSRTFNNDQLGFNPDGSAVNPWAFRQHILNDYDMMARIHMNDPELAKILGRESRDDLDWLQLLLRTRHSQRSELQRQRDEELALLRADQSDPEVRRNIRDAFPHNGVVEEWNADVEDIGRYIPQQERPYVEVEVNGKSLKALVDTGAAISTMIESCAKECGLSKLINRSDAETINGVGGESKTVGRINIAPIKIGNMFCLITFLVFKSCDEECILGMDVFRKNQCIVDTNANVLRIRGGVDVPFS